MTVPFTLGQSLWMHRWFNAIPLFRILILMPHLLIFTQSLLLHLLSFKWNAMHHFLRQWTFRLSWKWHCFVQMKMQSHCWCYLTKLTNEHAKDLTSWTNRNDKVYLFIHSIPSPSPRLLSLSSPERTEMRVELCNSAWHTCRAPWLCCGDTSHSLILYAALFLI